MIRLNGWTSKTIFFFFNQAEYTCLLFMLWIKLELRDRLFYILASLNLFSSHIPCLSLSLFPQK